MRYNTIRPRRVLPWALVTLSVGALGPAAGMGQSVLGWDFNCPKPGTSIVVYDDVLSIILDEGMDLDEARAVLRRFSLEPRLSEHTYDASGAIVSFSLIVDVDNGEAIGWLNLLTAANLFKDVCLHPATTASADEAAVFYLPSFKPMTLAGIEGARSLTTQHIREFFGSYYAGRGELQFVRQEEFNIKAVVTSLRSEVLRDRSYWEMLSLNVFLVPGSDVARVFLVVDGQFAPGIGEQIPPAEAFQFMDKLYLSQLKNYAGEILVRLREWLEKRA